LEQTQDPLITLPIPTQLTQPLRHTEEPAEHHTSGEKLSRKNEKEKEEKEDENPQPLYYLNNTIKSGIGGLPNHCTSQTCK
jgi:hypothetical protein